MTSVRPSSQHRSRPPTCPDENELVLLADGLLADRRRASIDRHLDGCATCTLLVAELAGMAAPLRPVPPRYKIIRQLGAGAMGVVWEAEDKNLGRRVALKFVRADPHAHTNTRSSKSSSRERRTRLFREARALAQLRHPNVVNVYDVGESGDELFLALELVIGMDARTWRITQPRSPDDIMNVWRQAAAGLAAVHRAGLVHRDIKPDNILVADDGRVLVGDFGLATDHGTTTTSRHAHERLTAVEHLTATGAIVGTPIYMAYEQLVGEPASQKSDQFALCVSMWEALAGERPFSGPTLTAIAGAMQLPPTPPPSRRPADRDIFTVLARGLDPNPARRWPSIDALLAALTPGASHGRDSRVRALRPASKSRAAWLAVGAALLAAVATVGVLAWRDRDDARASHIEARDLATPTERAKPNRALTAPKPMDRPPTPMDRASTTQADLATSIDRTLTPPPPPTAGTPTSDRVPTQLPADHAPTTPPPTTNRTMTPSMQPSAPTPRTDRAPSTTPPSAAPPTTSTPRPPDGNAYVTQSDWQQTIERAASKLSFGDAAGCLRVLADMPAPPAVMVAQTETVRARCTMKAGDCARGRAMLEAVNRHTDTAVRAAIVREADYTYCPLEAGPRERWAPRAQHRLVLATVAKTSCRPVLAFMKKHDVKPTDPIGHAMIEATCLVIDGDCAGARAVLRRDLTVNAPDDVFANAFPNCR